jgi:hypothetical protein
MSGFDHSRLTAGDKMSGATAFGDRDGLSRTEIGVHVAQAHALRADCMRQWFKRLWTEFGSVFRRPGRLAPRVSNRMQTSTR